jgi:type I restriction enzyme, S subunit
MKPGYKQTEVGVIPEEWKVKSFSHVTDLITCGIAATPRYVSENQGYPFLSSTNIKEGQIVWAGYKHISVDLHRQLFRNNPPKRGDILYSRVGTFGEAGVVDVDFEFSIYVSLTLIKPGKTLDSYYLMQLLNSNAYKQRAKEQIYLGGGVGNLNVDVVRRYPIPLPPLPEQRAIAAALSDVDALLGGLERLITKKRDLKQAAMQQLLTGQTRLPGFDGAWEVKRLKTIVQIPVTDGPHLTPEFFDDGIPFLSVNNLVGNKIDITDLRFISRQDHELFSRKCKPRKNDILLGKAASVGKVAIVELDFEFNIWSPIALIRISENNAARFVYYQLQSADLISQITLLTNSSSQGNIGMGDIEKLTLSLPPLPEQIAIAAVLSDMDAELVALEQRRTKTRALKQAMMQELLTGRTRLIARGDAENAE